MRWRYETYLEKDTRLSQWHKWFAWHPVWWNGKAAWFTTIERRFDGWVYPGDRTWEYKIEMK